MTAVASVDKKRTPGLRAYLMCTLVLLGAAACSDSEQLWPLSSGPTAVIANGTPATASTTAAFAITVGGEGAVAYKYSIDGGAFSAEVPVATPISGTLADGQHTLRIIARTAGGVWQAETAATTYTWTISTSGYSFARKIGGAWTNASQGQLKGGNGIAVDAAGNSYVVDQENHRVQKFDATGNFVTTWGTLGAGNTNLNYPTGIALDANCVYVADYLNHRIVKYDHAGVYQSHWSTGANSYPTSIVCSGATLYVTRNGDDTVIGYDTAGNILHAARTMPTNPLAVGLDNAGNVYVGCENAVMYKLPANLSGSAVFYNCAQVPLGIAGDDAGNLYVSYQNASTLIKLNSAATLVATYGTSYYSTPGSFTGPKGVAVADGALYVAEASRAQKLSLAGVSQLIYACVSDDDGYLRFPQGLAVDSAGNVYVSDFENHRIQKFASNGSFLSKWGGHGSAHGDFNRPWGLVLDAAGNLYVSDYQNDRIQKFDAAGNYLTTIGSAGSADGQLNGPTGLAINSDGHLLAMDSLNHRAQVFSLAGAFISKWGSLGAGDGQLNEPDGVVMDEAGNAYVVDVENHRIQKFSALGAYLIQWGTQGSGAGQFSFPYGIARDHGGNIYVADRNNDRVLKFDSNGAQLAAIGTSGSGDGQLNDPTGVWVDASGKLYVVDKANHRVQVFSPL